MVCAELILAAALLTAPTEGDYAPLDRLRPAVVQMALALELIDPREDRFQAATYGAADDVNVLRRRYAALRHAPPLVEVERFPTRAVINDLLSYNRAYRDELLARQAVDGAHAEELRIALDETEQLYRVWDTLRDARCGFYYVTVRREALQRFRELVGLRAFYSGELPPHLPYWHFPPAR